MVLNYIWIFFFVAAFVYGLAQLIFMGNTEVFQNMVQSTFDTSKTAFETSLGLTGVLALWLGIMKIGERAGAVNVLARMLSPVFTKLFPDIPKNHPVMGSIFMNIASNMLGLDNAATPTGLKAMAGMQELNPHKDTATNPMIMFLVLNTSGLTMDKDTMATVTSVASNLILLSVIITFIVAGFLRHINVYDAFVEGAKEGFTTAVRIIPYLVAILVAVGVFRASGAMDLLINGIAWVVKQCGLNTDFVGALPTAFMKPLSGSGARGLMLEAMKNYGPDSFVGRLSCIFQGSTDTTFYILAVYFGSVNIKYTRHAVACGLLADLAGVIAAIGIAYIFF